MYKIILFQSPSHKVTRWTSLFRVVFQENEENNGSPPGLTLTRGLGSERNGPVLHRLTLFPVTSLCSTLQRTPPIIPSVWLTLNLIGCCEKDIQSRGRGCSVSADITGFGGNMFSVWRMTGRWSILCRRGRGCDFSGLAPWGSPRGDKGGDGHSC